MSEVDFLHNYRGHLYRCRYEIRSSQLIVTVDDHYKTTNLQAWDEPSKIARVLVQEILVEVDRSSE